VFLALLPRLALDCVPPFAFKIAVITMCTNMPDFVFCSLVWHYWGFELRVLCCTTWAMPPVLFCFCYIWDRVQGPISRPAWTKIFLFRPPT
jgi:hypothetical protein